MLTPRPTVLRLDPLAAAPATDDAPVARRWEWRSFTRTFAGGPVGELASCPETEETYLLSLNSPHNVKIRAGRLEIKRLLRVDSDGLELWERVVTAPFPIGDAVVAAAYQALGLPVRPPAAGLFSMAEFLDRTLQTTRGLRIVMVAKRRLPSGTPGCAGECGQIAIGRHRWNTKALDDTDPARLRARLRELGYNPGANESYPAALKRIQALYHHSPIVFEASIAG